MSHSSFFILYSANNTTFTIGFIFNDSKSSTDCSRYVNWPTNTEWLDFVSNSHKLSYVCVATLRKQYSLVEFCCSGVFIRANKTMVEVVNLGGKLAHNYASHTKSMQP